MNNLLKKMLKIMPLGCFLCLAILLAACSSEPPVVGGGTPTPAPTATQSTSSAAVIHTASINVKGTTETVLTDSKGNTLYYFTPDTAAKVACTGDCASTWPPETFSGTGTPTSDPTLPGTLSTQSNANGNQILYNNHYLYTFSGDTAPGQANGQGIGNKWFVATPGLK
jgi:predicted lipoprotein with Yx(FWY)xxD motif